MKSIIMSAPSVRSTLADLKINTRRIVKLPRWAIPSQEIWLEHLDGDGPLWPHACHIKTGRDVAIEARYVPGDIAYVKEAWRMGGRGDFEWEEGVTPVDYQADGRTIFHDTDSLGLYPHGDPDADKKHWLPKRHEHHADQARWRSPLFMPEWASRLKIEFTSVRCERLQEISEEDAIAEGIWAEFQTVASALHLDGNAYYHGSREQRSGGFDTAVQAYAHLWESIHGEGSWEENPFVWVYGYRRVK